MFPTQFTQETHPRIKLRVETGEAALIDVREQDEWDASHLQQAVSVPLSWLADEATRTEALTLIPRDRPVYCHCQRGIRALQCARFLNQLGYEILPIGDDYEDLAGGVFDAVP